MHCFLSSDEVHLCHILKDINVLQFAMFHISKILSNSFKLKVLTNWQENIFYAIYLIDIYSCY